MRVAILFIFLFLSLNTITFAQEVNKIAKDADNLEIRMDESGALNKYLDAIKLAPNNWHFLSKISELYSSIAGREKNSTVQNSYFANALIYANRALIANPRSDEANFVMALVLGRTALKKSGREKIDAVKGIKKYTDIAIQLNPENYKAWFLLGKWYYEISGLNFFERTAVKMFYGELPPASNKEAIKAYTRSLELNRGFLFNYLSLSKAYIRDGNKDKARDLLTTMAKLPLRTADDSSIKFQGNILLNKL